MSLYFPRSQEMQMNCSIYYEATPETRWSFPIFTRERESNPIIPFLLLQMSNYPYHPQMSNHHYKRKSLVSKFWKHHKSTNQTNQQTIHSFLFTRCSSFPFFRLWLSCLRWSQLIGAATPLLGSELVSRRSWMLVATLVTWLFRCWRREFTSLVSVPDTPAN